MPVTIRYWGVRGTIPSPGAKTLRYGGNTSCIEVRCGDRLLILDGGSGLRQFGATLMAQGSRLDCDIFYTHYHLDHLIGLPFFAPAYVPGNRLRLWGPRLARDSTLVRAVEQLMSAPLVPVGLGVLDTLPIRMVIHGKR